MFAGKRKPFPGTSEVASDRMRRVLADQFGGLTLTEACEREGTSLQAFGQLTHRNAEAWSLCQQEIQEAVLNNIALNAWISRSLVSDVGPHAVRTLYDLMIDPTTPASTREKAAKDILDLMDIGGKAHIGNRLEESVSRFADLLEITTEKQEDNRVIDAEYEDDGGVGDTAG